MKILEGAASKVRRRTTMILLSLILMKI